MGWEKIICPKPAHNWYKFLKIFQIIFFIRQFKLHINSMWIEMNWADEWADLKFVQT